MKSLMIAAMHSGAGKTVVSCSLMAALKKRGFRVQAFKSGPDYIDPMFHRRVLGLESRNLDLFLQGREGVRRSFAGACGEIAVIEGAMGYYDGLGGGTKASAWELADLLEVPVILVLRPKGSGITLAAQLHGLQSFRPNSRIAGVLLNDCPPHLAEMLVPVLETECGVPVLGFLPPMEEARLESRRLGLLTPAEVEHFSRRMAVLADALEKNADLDALLALSAEKESHPDPSGKTPPRCRIAVARDEAFCFQYADNLNALRRAGAELSFFSPIRDSALPEATDGLYLCGGYPELYAGQLAQNRSMCDAVRTAVVSGLPTVAECGGFLYLQQRLEDEEGVFQPMCAALPGEGFRTNRLQRFGYLTLEAGKDSLLFRSGEQIPAHEFHYWDSSENGTAFTARKADGRSWRCGFAGASLYAAFPHLNFNGVLPLAERFAEACVNREKREQERATDLYEG